MRFTRENPNRNERGETGTAGTTGMDGEVPERERPLLQAKPR